MDVWFSGEVIQLLHTTQYMEAAVCVCVTESVSGWVYIPYLETSDTWTLYQSVAHHSQTTLHCSWRGTFSE